MSSDQPETRTRILSAALELLKENQGRGVRMGDIARAAGLSRQAVYLHFKSRAALMVATVQYGDEVLDAASQVQPWRDCEGAAKLDAWIVFWGNYIPQVFGVAKALMLARETDEAAAAAWDDRMSDIRGSCRTTMQSLASAGELAPGWEIDEAAELLWTILSFASWEQLTRSCGWSHQRYVDRMRTLARSAFLKN